MRTIVKNNTYKATQWIYFWIKVVLSVVYIVGFLGIWKISPSYLHLINSMFNIIVASILIYFFNPFRKIICNEFQRKVVFSAGAIMLLQTSLIQYLNPQKIVNKILS